MIDFETETIGFSYPVNTKYPNCISLSGVKSGLLVAYASSNLVVVLNEGKYLTAVLRGHREEVCTVSFENRKLSIFSCDISGYAIIWEFQNPKFVKSNRIIHLKSPAISCCWYTIRQKICIASEKEGLLYSAKNDIENHSTQLLKKSKFCDFNYDGSLLVSHEYKKVLTIFVLSAIPMRTQVIRLSKKILNFDFHPFLPMFLTITDDYVLRIFKQTTHSNFCCTTAVKVPLLGIFVRTPPIFAENTQYSTNKPAKIVFMSLDKETKVYKLKISDDGKIINIHRNQLPNTFKKSNISNHKLLGVYKTNLGTESFLLSKNGFIVISKNSKRSFVYHNSPVIFSEFNKKGNWIITKDESNLLISWTVYNPFSTHKIISENAMTATWINDNIIFFVENGHFNLFDVTNSSCNRIQNESNIIQDIGNLKDILTSFCREKILYILTRNSLITISSIMKSNNCLKKVCFNENIIQYSISEVYMSSFLLITSSKPNSKSNCNINIYLYPTFQKINVISDPLDDIKSICIISFLNFAVLENNNTIRFFRFFNNQFEQISMVQINGIHQIYCRPSNIGGCLFYHTTSQVFIFNNCSYSSTPLIKLSENDRNKISHINVNSYGNAAIFYGKSFHVFYLFSKYKKIISKLCSEAKKEICYYSPFNYIKISDFITNNIASTLFYQLDFNEIINLKCKRLPTVLKYANHVQNLFPPEFFQIYEEEKNRIIESEQKNDEYDLRNDKFDIDTYGNRFLLAYKTPFATRQPPYYFLWLSFSLTQNAIIDYLIDFLVDKITDPSISSYIQFIPFAIHSHTLLIKFVKALLLFIWRYLQSQFDNESINNEKISTHDANGIKIIDHIILPYVAMGQVGIVSNLFGQIGDTKRKEFFKKQFSKEKEKESARKNAYSALSHGFFGIAAALFLLIGEYDTAFRVILGQLKDPVLLFLVIRLLSDSDYDNIYFKWFIENCKWDNTQQIYIDMLLRNLCRESNISSLFPDVANTLLVLLFDRNRVNRTDFGDMRISLFDVYWNIVTKNNRIQSNDIFDNFDKLENILIEEKLTPLAKHLYKIVEKSEICYVRSETKDWQSEESIIHPKFETNNDEKWNDFIGFDFGGVNEKDFSDFEESFDSSETNEFDQSDVNKEDAKLDKFNMYNRTEQNIFLKYKKYQTLVLSRIYEINCKNSVEDDDLGHFLLLSCNYKKSHNYLNEESKELIYNSISSFIDRCIVNFYNSAFIPTKPNILLMCIQNLFKLSNNINVKTDEIELSYNIIAQNKVNARSVFNGSIILALWTFNPDFLLHLISENHSINKNLNLKESIYKNIMTPKQLLLFEMDWLSPRFPGSIITVLKRFLSHLTTELSMERSYILIVFLLFRCIFKINCSILNKKDQYDINMHSFLAKRLKTIMKTISFYQISLGAPPFAEPLPATDESPYNSIIDDMYEFSYSALNEIQINSLNKLSFSFDSRSAIFEEHYEFETNCLFIKSFHLMPINRNSKAIMLGNNSKLVRVTFPENFPEEPPLFDEISEVNPSSSLNGISNYNDSIIGLAIHPTYNLFLAISSSSILLYDYDHGLKEYQIIQSTKEKITCANFSPNGTKFVVCTANTIDIFTFNLAKVVARPTISKKIHNKNMAINNIVWINKDTSLAVSCTSGSQNNSQKSYILLFDTFGNYFKPIDCDPKWGKITALSTDTRNSVLILGTKNGYTILFDVKGMFPSPTHSFNHGVPISSLSTFETFTLISTDEKITLITTSKQSSQTDSIKLIERDVDFKVNCVEMSNKIAIAVGETSKISFWRKKE
ncbi:hypothetical protein TRFO_18091 [Tritrichomonas foetus]|uniref:RAVE complex protein Rav1 C-terminal domain-containing protein n=1 Tax=Tritrichomonas foetus TaxID=1144522 RepID=A0A1J4KLL7_9EUKA|nr:hypothetical protein TRFO_18091 [Tritrichomonas foetus]|eukprot:OHT12193.1 hypothetical protein TRFO_18091 [Tritrichomonas foetus]